MTSNYNHSSGTLNTIDIYLLTNIARQLMRAFEQQFITECSHSVGVPHLWCVDTATFNYFLGPTATTVGEKNLISHEPASEVYRSVGENECFCYVASYLIL